MRIITIYSKSSNASILVNDINSVFTYLYDESRCMSVTMHPPKSSYMDCKNFLLLLDYKEHTDSRAWVHPELNTVAYILWDWDKHSWYISVYRKN